MLVLSDSVCLQTPRFGCQVREGVTPYVISGLNSWARRDVRLRLKTKFRPRRKPKLKPRLKLKSKFLAIRCLKEDCRIEASREMKSVGILALNRESSSQPNSECSLEVSRKETLGLGT